MARAPDIVKDMKAVPGRAETDRAPRFHEDFLREGEPGYGIKRGYGIKHGLGVDFAEVGAQLGHDPFGGAGWERFAP